MSSDLELIDPDAGRGTLRGIPAAAPFVPVPVRVEAEERAFEEEFRRKLNRRLVASGFALIAAGRRVARLQRDGVDCTWQLKPSGLAYQLRYLDPDASAVSSDADSRTKILRGAPVSQPFAAMTELDDIAAQLTTVVSSYRAALPARLAAYRDHVAALEKWKRDKLVRDEEESARLRAEAEANDELDRARVEDAADEAREDAALAIEKEEAEQLARNLPEGWTATASRHGDGRVVLQSSALPAGLARKLSELLPVIDDGDDYESLERFLRSSSAASRAGLLSDGPRRGAGYDPYRGIEDERRRRERSILGRLLRRFGWFPMLER